MLYSEGIDKGVHLAPILTVRGESLILIYNVMPLNRDRILQATLAGDLCELIIFM